MSPLPHLQSSGTSNDLRKIGKWSRIYAQNRSLGMVVFMVIFLILSAAIGGPSYFGSMAYHNGQWPLFWICMAILIAALAATVFLAVPWWGGKFMERMTERLYAGEGKAQLVPPCTQARRRFAGLMCILFAACIIASVVMGFLCDIPVKYMQPISAIYTVPFLVVLLLLMRPAVGLIIFLWPMLYALHAVLLLAGVPILFTGAWDLLNMLIPTVGYGLLTGVLAHVYSRIALHRLRRTACAGLQDDLAEDERP